MLVFLAMLLRLVFVVVPTEKRICDVFRFFRVVDAKIESFKERV